MISLRFPSCPIIEGRDRSLIRLLDESPIRSITGWECATLSQGGVLHLRVGSSVELHVFDLFRYDFSTHAYSLARELR